MERDLLIHQLNGRILTSPHVGVLTRVHGLYDSRNWFFSVESLPMGLLGSPATFGRMMENVMRFRKCIYYQDNVLVDSKSHKKQIAELQKCLNRRRAAGLKMNAKKCSFCQEEVKYLGFTLMSAGVLPGKEKTRAIEEYQPPLTARQVREFTGLCYLFIYLIFFRQTVVQ